MAASATVKKKPTSRRQVFGGVDTHQDSHHAAVVDRNGSVLGDRQFPATGAGYQQLLDWLRGFGRLAKVGVEGTGSYGAGLTRHLRTHAVAVVEVDRPDRQTRRRQGKSDPIDAIAAARAALAGTAAGVPKSRTGPVEAIRALRVVRGGAVKARTAARNQFHGLLTTAPEQLRAELRSLSTAAKLKRCNEFTIDEQLLHDPCQAAKAALRALAARITALNTEVRQADKRLRHLVARTAPRLIAINGVGAEVAGQLLTTAGDNPDRLRSEAALARLAGVAPIPASSGRTDRHRLHRGGDRAANTAFYTIVLTRMATDPRTKTYVERRTKQGRTIKEIIRCLKRYVVREVYTAVLADYTALIST